ncbi:hypothetical protein V6N12_013003 [Hibiscus sabdariffa]|uniref:Uncharacterized protein n=1 Tax=Hibiscus sabdariffa TaxID=183260 RepID=A0ABR2EID9_9ROSI
MGGTKTPRTGSIKSGRLDKLASPLHTSSSVPTFGEIGVMPTKGKREPSCKSIEGSPTLAGAHSAKVSTKILWLRAGSRLVTPDFSDKNVCHVRP